MIRSFREFVNRTPFRLHLREEDAAPVMGASSSSPVNPDNSTTNKHHFDSLERGMGMDDEDMTAGLEGGSITVWRVPNYASTWGYLVVGPVDASIEKKGDGNYAVTFQLKNKQKMEPKSFYLPYRKGERPMYYQGPIEDKTEIMDEEELQDVMSMPFKMVGGAQPASMGGPMGGAPMGGAPPGGGPAGAPMGGM